MGICSYLRTSHTVWYPTSINFVMCVCPFGERYSVVDPPSLVFKILSNGFWFLKCLDKFTVVILCFVLIVWSFRLVKNTRTFDRQRFSVVNRNYENDDFGKYYGEHCQQNSRGQGKFFGQNTIGRSLRDAKRYIILCFRWRTREVVLGNSCKRYSRPVVTKKTWSVWAGPKKIRMRIFSDSFLIINCNNRVRVICSVMIRKYQNHKARQQKWRWTNFTLPK